jgi:hypothetical protein
MPTENMMNARLNGRKTCVMALLFSMLLSLE